MGNGGGQGTIKANMCPPSHPGRHFRVGCGEGADGRGPRTESLMVRVAAVVGGPAPMVRGAVVGLFGRSLRPHHIGCCLPRLAVDCTIGIVGGPRWWAASRLPFPAEVLDSVVARTGPLAGRPTEEVGRRSQRVGLMPAALRYT